MTQYQSMMELCGRASYLLEVRVSAHNPDGWYDAHKAGPKECMKENRPLVCVVDDDESVRESLPDLLNELGFAPQAFSSAEAFLASDCVDETNCLILDFAMPGMSGPDLQRELKLRHQQIPIVFITARRDDTVRALMLQRGAGIDAAEGPRRRSICSIPQQASQGLRRSAKPSGR